VNHSQKPVSLPPPPFALPLSREELASALQKGHGRALLHARQHDLSPFTDVVIDACIHHRAYDPQCEGDRAQWMMRIVDAAELHGPVCEAVVRALALDEGERTFWDAIHVCAMARLLAERGHESARRALYGAFRKSDSSLDLIGGEDLVRLDGADGLIFVADRMGQWLEADPALSLDDEPLRWYDEVHGDGAAIRLLERMAGTNPHIERYLRRIGDGATPDAKRGGWIRPANVPLSPDAMSPRYKRVRSMSADEVILDIHSSGPGDHCYRLMTWGMHASAADLEQVAAAMFRETDPVRLQKFLRAFRRRAMPTFDDRLLQRADHPDPEVRTQAITALAQNQQPGVRRLAMERLARGQIADRELILMKHNYRDGDHLLIGRALSIPDHQGALHSLVYDLVEVISANVSAEAADLLLFVYEHSPCGNCRTKAVKALLGVDALPAWVRNECGWDVEDGVRDAVG